jgi:hypothetical protein
LDTKILKKIVENRVIQVDEIGEIEPENDDTRFLELTDLIEYSEQVEERGKGGKGGKEAEEGSAPKSQIDPPAAVSETVSVSNHGNRIYSVLFLIFTHCSTFTICSAMDLFFFHF